MVKKDNVFFEKDFEKKNKSFMNKLKKNKKFSFFDTVSYFCLFLMGIIVLLEVGFELVTGQDSVNKLLGIFVIFFTLIIMIASIRILSRRFLD